MNISYNNALNADVISGGIMGFDLTYLVYKKFIKIIESYLKLKLPFMCPCADTAVISNNLFMPFWFWGFIILTFSLFVIHKSLQRTGD